MGISGPDKATRRSGEAVQSNKLADICQVDDISPINQVLPQTTISYSSASLGSFNQQAYLQINKENEP